MDNGGDAGRSPQAGGEGGPGNWLALVLLLALVAAGVLVVNAIVKQVSIQNCVLSGRRDCVPIVPGQ